MQGMINGHLISIPKDMNGVWESGFPGAFDYITYRGFNIYTQDVEDYDGGVYAGKFYVEDCWGHLTVVNTLDDARELIDIYLEENF